MKKLLGIVVLGLLWCNVAAVEEKIKVPEDFEYKPVTVSSLVAEGFKIIDVQQQDAVLIYTLQKSKRVFACTVILGKNITRCYTP